MLIQNERPAEYYATRIDNGEIVYGDYLQKDPIFGWKIINTAGEYRVHADTIMRLAGRSDCYGEEFGNGYVYRSWAVK